MLFRPSQLSAANRKASPARHNASFGLKSPDALPCSVLSDAELQEIIASCGLEGQTLEELLLLFPDNFCPDTEIIDLTLLPSPAIDRPVEATGIDVASITAVNPPTPFRDDDPKEQFAAVMERLAKGDVRVIDDSHQKATQSKRHLALYSVIAYRTARLPFRPLWAAANCYFVSLGILRTCAHPPICDAPWHSCLGDRAETRAVYS